jgi:hypothetical protein
MAKMDAVGSLGTLLPVYQTKRHHIPRVLILIYLQKYLLCNYVSPWEMNFELHRHFVFITKGGDKDSLTIKQFYEPQKTTNLLLK